jgi:hypothetical protein
VGCCCEEEGKEETDEEEEEGEEERKTGKSVEHTAFEEILTGWLSLVRTGP